MEGFGVVVLVFIFATLFGYKEATISSWNSWSMAGSVCRNDEVMTRSRLHVDPRHRNKYYERYEETADKVLLENIALKQPATMSSKYQDYGAELLTDGIMYTDMYFGSCAQTKMETSPWFRIDLEVTGYKSYVEEIIIFNRDDCCSSRANNLTITIGDDPNGNDGTLCNVKEDMNLRLVRILCNKPSFGRYIHLRVPGPQILHLCEVLALGGRYKNVALGKSVAASSVDYPAERITDGDLDSYSENRFSDYAPWYRIDIGQVVQVHMVRVYGESTDGNYENSLISVGKDDEVMAFCGVVSKANKIDGKKKSYIVKCELKGRYVQINLIKPEGSYLGLYEIEVLGDL